MYGIGKNTEAILRKAKGFQFCGLMDQNTVGQTIFQQKVLSEEEVIKLHPVIVIIARESVISIIYKRIQYLYVEHGINIFNYKGEMLGKEQQTYQNEELPYWNVSEKDILREIKKHDIISFDIFDTLIFRPFSSPTDVFYLIGEKFDFLDFKNLRVWAEWDARMKCRQKNGHTEVSLQDIWENLEEDTGLNAEEGMRLECETEEKLCYANPYMLQVWKRLQELEKRMIIVSDMYLPRSCIERILQKAGYTGAERIYISNEYGENKAGGDLFHRVIRDFSGARIVHIGDNPHSDQKMAKASGLDILPYQNVNKNVLLYLSLIHI